MNFLIQLRKFKQILHHLIYVAYHIDKNASAYNLYNLYRRMQIYTEKNLFKYGGPVVKCL